MKNKNVLLQSFYKSLIKPVKHSINIYDILLFTALFEHWSTIVKNISEDKEDQKDNKIEIAKVENAILSIEVTDPQRLFMLSLKTHIIMASCNAVLKTINWFEIGETIGLESLDIPNGEFFIKKISLTVKH